MAHYLKSLMASILVMFIILGYLVQHLSTVKAAEFDELPTLTVDCGSISLDGSGKGVAATRDNTGTGFENVVLEVRDGTGNLLFSYSLLLDVAANETSGLPLGGLFSTVPSFNPVVAHLYSPAGNGVEAQELLSTGVECDGLSTYVVPGTSAPGIPDGFVLRTVICDVPVYNTASGSPVEGSTIIKGQTWYVNSEAVTAGDGSQWTEIFTSGPINGFVPTICVS